MHYSSFERAVNNFLGVRANTGPFQLLKRDSPVRLGGRNGAGGCETFVGLTWEHGLRLSSCFFALFFTALPPPFVDERDGQRHGPVGCDHAPVRVFRYDSQRESAARDRAVVLSHGAKNLRHSASGVRPDEAHVETFFLAVGAGWRARPFFIFRCRRVPCVSLWSAVSGDHS